MFYPNHAWILHGWSSAKMIKLSNNEETRRTLTVNGTMKVAVMEGIGKMGYIERPIPEVKPDEVLVKLEYVGIWWCCKLQRYYNSYN